MATFGSLLSEEQLRCPICLDLFNRPVSTPCGHNFCGDCIRGYWQSTDMSLCPICKHKFYKRPELKVNTFIAEVAAQFRTSRAQDIELSSDQTSCKVLCDVCVGRKVPALKSCLDCLASFCETHLEPHHVLGTFKKHTLIAPRMNMQERVCVKHEKLLKLFCNNDQTYICPICTQEEHSDHHTVPIEDQGRKIKEQIGELNVKVEKMIEGRIQKMDMIQEAIELSRNNSQAEIKEGLHIFSKLFQLLQKDQDEVREAINTKQRQVETNAKGAMLELEQEINELRQRSIQLEHLSNITDDLYLLKSFPALSQLPVTKDGCETVVESAVYVGTLRRAVRKVASKIDETVKDEVKRLCSTEFQRARHYAVNVTLDPDTAHPKLVLSENLKQVYHNDMALNVPENPKRFYPCVSVLGKEGFSCGRFYFEVVVKGKTEWDIGVGRESMNRKGGNTLNPENGYWALGMRNPKSYWALSSTPIAVPLVTMPQKMGVYVDIEGGQVSFYNVDSASHIYSFTGYSFTEKLYPYFNPRRNHGGTNSAPLIISSVV
ncbi:hypothetical protein NL108_007672 [Boleophthalmus pectinirostris]|uniref:zinc-binding protein A33-like n=1 Tax=Boleophthalmus pectinirostris TaxID=150288 RepID=UPI000A1C50B2|nr:zinc-binding protein A33-like [Boleophthalmus pectinirostris]KAJ0047312.1 hypothetical protein NL108_007672 [Boleophthalmus pectinirostris]